MRGRRLIFYCGSHPPPGLHVHIFDSKEEQYQLTEDIWPRPLSINPRTSLEHKSDLILNYDSSPFAYWIERRSTGEIIFDTRAKNLKTYEDLIDVSGKKKSGSELPAYPLIFEDQYLQMATSVPEGNSHIYGLGEVVSTSGFRRNSTNSLSTFWSRDAADPEDENLYGAFPSYVETRWNETESRSYSHGVFFLNPHGLDVLQRSGVIEYRSLGGTLDFYFVSGPDPKSVISQFGEITGFPQPMPYWAFGFHLCRWGWGSIEESKAIVQSMRDANIPLETIWNDIDWMKRYRNFETDPNYS